MMQDDQARYPGSRWLKFDFHTHTPASGGDYGRGDAGAMQVTPEAWLKAAMDAGLDCVVVSDHNSGDWIDRLKSGLSAIRGQEEKPDWYRELTIFPGVEITVADSSSRVHLLGIFDPAAETGTITAVLGACGIYEGRGNPETSTATGFADTVAKIVESGGIAVPAHIDGPGGLLETATGLTPEVKKSLARVAGAEFCDVHRFDSADPGLKTAVDALAKLAGSDAHKPEEIGRHSTWVKMSRPSIDCLGLALMDHEFCIINQDHDPNHEPDMYLSFLSISRMSHCGRVEPLTLLLHPHFNAFIGGRGTGKSTLLESIRIAARREGELSPFEKLNREFQQFLKAQQGSRKDRGVMLEDTEILLGVHRMGRDYQLRWRYDGGGAVLEEKEETGWQAVEQGNLRERFPISIYSQKQINELAANPRGLLEIVDRSPLVDRPAWDRLWEDVKSRFFQLREQERTLNRRLAEEAPLKAKLTDLENNLRQYEQKGHGDILNLYQKRSQQKAVLPRDDVFDSLAKGLRDLAETAGLSDFQSHLFNKEDTAVDELRTIHDTAAKGLEEIGHALTGLAARVDTLKAEKNRVVEAGSWYRSLQDSVAAYNALVEEYQQKESRISLSLYGDWVREKNRIQQQLKQLASLQNEKKRVTTQIGDCYEVFLSLRKELNDRRRAFIDQVIGSSDYVRMELVQFGDVSDVEDQYRKLLNLEENRFISSVLDRGQEQGILWEFCCWEDRGKSEEDLGGLIEKIKLDTFDISLGRKTGNHGAFDNRLKSLNDQHPGIFDQLWAFWPEDLLRVKYSKDPESRKFEDLEKGSAGQKAAAILAFLLSHGEEPLVIDQPEDDLDNALISDLIVTQIHANKTGRQLIIITHNPNIVVNGDAELVHVLKFEGGQVRVAAQDGLVADDIRKAICTIMEGGRTAFDKRYKRITLGG